MIAASKKRETDLRPDAGIAGDILRGMKAALDVPEDRIQAKVADGIVTLFGTVAHDRQKRAAEACIAKVNGVRGVRSLIEVDPAAQA